MCPSGFQQRVELVARVDVVVIDIEELRRNPRARGRFRLGITAEGRYATCWRRAASVSTDSDDDGSRSACSSATRSSASCANPLPAEAALGVWSPRATGPRTG